MFGQMQCTAVSPPLALLFSILTFAHPFLLFGTKSYENGMNFEKISKIFAAKQKNPACKVQTGKMIQSIVHVALEIRTKLLAVIQTNFTLAEDTCRPEQDKRWGPGFGRTYRAIKAAYSAAEFVRINFVIDAKQTVDIKISAIVQPSSSTK